MLCQGLVLCTIAANLLHTAVGGALLSPFKYKIVDLETNGDLCSGSSLGSRKVSILPDQPVIIRLGHMLIYDPSKVRRCELKIEAPSGYGISMTINSINLSLHKHSGSISCDDYVQFSREWDSFLAKALAKVSDSFADKSDTICGTRSQRPSDRPELYHVGKTANIFSTVKNKLKFKYVRGDDGGRDKEFVIVATAFKTTNGTCPEAFIRCGTDSISYCISETLRCDNYINCGFPRSGVDEQGCDDSGWHLDGAMSTQTFIWVTLVLSLAVFICCLISCAMRCWAGPGQSASGARLWLWFANGRSPAGSGPTSSSGGGGGGGTAPAGRQHLSPLPSYDSVVRDLGSRDADLQSPPAYKDLFPEPPATPPEAERVPLDPAKRLASERRRPPADG